MVQEPKTALEEQYSLSEIEQILVPADVKLRLLKYLDQLGFNHERLFPGLDGASALLSWRFEENIGKWRRENE